MLAQDYDGIVAFTRRGHEILKDMRALDKPVITVIGDGGVAIGGGFELFLHSPNGVMKAKARMVQLPETSIGIYPGLGGTQLVTYRIKENLMARGVDKKEAGRLAKSRAKQLVLANIPVNPQQAYELGIVNVRPGLVDDFLKKVRAASKKGTVTQTEINKLKAEYRDDEIPVLPLQDMLDWAYDDLDLKAITLRLLSLLEELSVKPNKDKERGIIKRHYSTIKGNAEGIKATGKAKGKVEGRADALQTMNITFALLNNIFQMSLEEMMDKELEGIPTVFRSNRAREAIAGEDITLGSSKKSRKKTDKASSVLTSGEKDGGIEFNEQGSNFRITKNMPIDKELSLPDWVGDYISAHESEVYRTPEDRMAIAVELSGLNVDNKTGGPFGAAVFDLETGQLISIGVNRVVPESTSIAHGEMMALVMAQKRLGNFTLDQEGPGLELVTSAEPCAMCFGAIPGSGVKSVITGATKKDVEKITGFDEGPIPSNWPELLKKRNINVQRGVLRKEAIQVLKRYVEIGGKIYNAKDRGPIDAEKDADAGSSSSPVSKLIAAGVVAAGFGLPSLSADAAGKVPYINQSGSEQIIYAAAKNKSEEVTQPEKIDPLVQQIISSLKEVLKARDYFNRRKAIEALGNMGPVAIPALREALKDRSVGNRQKVIEALVNMGPVAIPALREALKDRYYLNRRKVIEALVNMGSVGIPTLKEALKDRSVANSQEVIEALVNMGPVAIPVLKEALKDRDYLNRRKVIEALGNMGPMAIPVLREALKDRSAGNRQKAIEALEKINRKEKGKSSSPVEESVSSTTTDRKGGIDLNPELLDLQIKRDGNGVPLPIFQQPIETMNIQGFLPVIINITPVTNLPALLGLVDEPGDSENFSFLPIQPMDKKDRLKV